MGKRKLGALEKVDADLPNLQHKIRRDPLSYENEFNSQYKQYDAYLQLVIQNPAAAPNDELVSLHNLIDFIAHVASCYPRHTAGFPQDLINLLSQHHGELQPELRDKIVGSLVLLRKKDLIDSSTLLNALFPILLSTSSKALRSLIYQKILSDIRTANAKTTNHKLNRSVQAVLFNLLTSDRTSSKGIWAVRISRELWKRQVWTDSKTVEIMKEAALSENVKILTAGASYFLGGDKEREEAADESSDGEDAIDMRQLRHQAGVNKKTKKSERDLKAAAQAVKKKERKKNQPQLLNFSALHLLHDPQGFAESLFSRHVQNPKSRLNLEQKLVVLQLVSRLVGLHKLTIISLYSYFLRFLTPRQAEATSFLASLAQATHNLVPPDVLEPLIQKIANEFVSEAAAGQVASAGLNAIREICVRQPLAMNEILLQDLVLYRKSKDKGVMMAAKGLLSLYRQVGAEMLHKRDRGREAALNLRSDEHREVRYGEEEIGQIEGIELLQEWKEEERRKERLAKGLPAERGSDESSASEHDDAEDWANWDVEEDESDDSGGWIDVASDSGNISVSDSDDDNAKAGKPPATKKLKQLPSSDQSTSANATNSASIATTRILTPADLAKLHELRLNRSVTALLPSARHAKHPTSRTTASAGDASAALSSRSLANENPVTAELITRTAGLSAGKATREERIASARAGKNGIGDGDGDDDKGPHQGKTARRKERRKEQGKSTTNEQKSRQKNFLMTVGKARGKSKRGLGEVRKALRGHVERRKKGGRRGNRQ